MDKITENKIYTYLGFAQKAGKTLAGPDLIKAKYKHKNDNLLIIAEDAAVNTYKDMLSFGEKNNIRTLVFGNKTQYGLAIGKSPRSAILINEKNLADKIWQICSDDIK